MILSVCTIAIYLDDIDRQSPQLVAGFDSLQRTRDRSGNSSAPIGIGKGTRSLAGMLTRQSTFLHRAMGGIASEKTKQREEVDNETVKPSSRFRRRLGSQRGLVCAMSRG